MRDLWPHSHDWDNGYCKGRKEGYQQGYANALTEIITHISACENEAYANCEPIICADCVNEKCKKDTPGNDFMIYSRECERYDCMARLIKVEE